MFGVPSRLNRLALGMLAKSSAFDSSLYGKVHSPQAFVRRRSRSPLQLCLLPSLSRGHGEDKRAFRSVYVCVYVHVYM